MKNSLTALLPALGLLALSGCAGTGAIATSEDDGVYYSSKDHTTAVVQSAPAYNSAPAYSSPSASAPATTDEAANPDYNGSTANNNQYDDGNGNTTGYSTSRVYPNGVPSYDYYAPGVTSYAPVAYAPYTSLAYSPYAPVYSPYGYSTVWADPFYSPYYSPYYGYGSGVSISIGFGRPWGYGYGGYGSPWGYGYGGFYDPYFYGGPFYSGYYGYGGYYGAGYYGGGYYNRNVIYTGGGGSYGDGRGRTVLVGPRRGRGGNVTTGGRAATTAGGGRPTGTPGAPTGGRTQAGGLPAGTQPLFDASATGKGRSMRADGLSTPAGTGRNLFSETGGARPVSAGNPATQPAGNATVRPTYVEGMNAQPTAATPGRDRGNWRNTMNNGQALQQPVAQPQPQVMPRVETERPRRSLFGGGGRTQSPDMAQPQQPSRSRGYEQPTYSQPSQPSRSYSQPSFGGGGGGGFGGGGGGRRGR